MKKIILSMALITAISFNSCNIDRYPASSMDGDEAIGNIDENFPHCSKVLMATSKIGRTLCTAVANMQATI